ncbi:MAG: sugar phosphate isomerase/epimerase [Alphaproteobacteria bacterium]|nr:sugar phosphate isomerase/epimerase [Alphaproteobacteria bacterium]
MSGAAAADVPLSLSYYTVPELSPPDAVHAAADAGFRSVGLRLLHGQPHDGQAPLMLDEGLRRATTDALAARGLAALDASAARLVPATEVGAFEPFLETAAAMGARHVLATVDDPELARAAEHMARLCEMAASHGVTVDLEFVPWMSVGDIAAAARFLATVAHPALGIAVDAMHVHRSGSRLTDLAAVPPDRLRYLQLCDVPAARPADREGLFAEATKERLLPGDGAVDLVGLLRAMPRGIPVALEIPMASLTRTMPAAERLRRMVDATRRVLAAAYA